MEIEMPLPKITYPLTEIKIPSTGKKTKVRPFLVKEEKILLMAKTGQDVGEILNSIKQVVNNCLIDDSIDVDKLTLFDVEYIFLKLRAISVSNICKVSYKDSEDEKVYNFDIDLNEVEVKFPENINKIIKINDTIGLIMKYPDASIYSDKEFFKSDKDDAASKLLARCIDKIYDGDEIYDPRDFIQDEINQFFDNLGSKTYEEMRMFIDDIPTLYHKIEYKNSNDQNRVIELTALTDFFTLL